MTDKQNKNQPTLFDSIEKNADSEKVILFALGEFQTRGFQLIDRELPLDRLRGAFKRAAEQFGLAEFSDEKIAEILAGLGADIKKVPSYVAKHPFRVTVKTQLAINSLEIYRSLSQEDKNK